MGVHVLKHGACKKRVMLFLCPRCGCLFETDEYGTYRDEKGAYFSHGCPECGQRVRRGEKDFKELRVES